jgi:hypothetical protein
MKHWAIIKWVQRYTGDVAPVLESPADGVDVNHDPCVLIEVKFDDHRYLVPDFLSVAHGPHSATNKTGVPETIHILIIGGGPF